ncbi:MAG: metallophosphoesterase [Treponema sp.]|jgi:predicted phosphodiesterase|nr:metallophosphoesterase [Treponema sp.]
MVRKSRLRPFWGLFPGFALVFAVLILFPACDVDLVGLFASSEPDERFKSRNTFHFLSPADLSLSLPSNYSFIVVSDTHIEDGNARGLEKIRDAAVAEGDAFVAVTGDITQNGKREDLEKFIGIADSLRAAGIPCYPVIGNHDVYFNNWPNWRDLIGSSTYRVDSPNSSTTLFMLDSANGSFGKDQIDWLREGLKSARPHVFIFTHANLFTENLIDIEQITDNRERARLLFLLDGRCDALFSGHVHNRITRKAGGVNYISLEDYRDNRTYCRVFVGPSGISWEFKKL